MSPLKVLGGVLGVLGLLCGVYAVRVEMKEITAADQTRYWPSKRFSRVQFAGPDTFTGVRSEEGQVWVERFTSGAWKTATVHSGSARVQGPIVASPEGNWAAWKRDQSLALWATDSSLAPAALPVDAVAFTFQGRSLLVVTKEGNLEWWNPATRARESAIPISDGAFEAAIGSGSVAVVDTSRSRLKLYSLGIGQRASLVEEARPMLNGKLMIGAGNLLQMRDGFVSLWKETYTLPGRVTSAVAGLRGEILVTGEFGGVFSLMKGKDPETILEERSGSVADASGSQLVLSGPGGSSLYQIASTRKFSRKGKVIAWLAGLSLAVSICLLFGRHLMTLLSWIIKRQSTLDQVRYGREELPKPGVELFDAFARGEVALWTGSGLGAQAGLPARSAFVKSLLETAYFEEWADPNEIAKLIVKAGDGRREEAVDKLLALLGDRQHLVFEQIRCHYQRTVNPVEVYESIGKLPFTVLVSGNYDNLIDSAGWVSQVPRVNLFGTASAADGILYTRSEMAAGMAKFPEGSELLKELFAGYRIVFVGCSIPELHADLVALGIPRVAGGAIVSKHLCIAAASPQWERKAKELHEWWGIEVQQCAEDYLPAQVRLWFANLVTALGASKKPESAVGAAAGARG